MPYKFKGKRDCKQSDGTKGKYLTVKKDGSRRCYKSEKQYKAAQAWAHEADVKEIDTLEEIRAYVRLVLSDKSDPGTLSESKVYNTFTTNSPVINLDSRADPEFVKLIKQNPVSQQYVDIQVFDEAQIRKQIRDYIKEASLGALFGGLEQMKQAGQTAGVVGADEPEGSITDDANALLSDLFPSAGDAGVDIEKIPKETETKEQVQSSMGQHMMAKLKEKGAIGLEGGGVDDGKVQEVIDELKAEIDEMAAGLGG